MPPCARDVASLFVGKGETADFRPTNGVHLLLAEAPGEGRDGTQRALQAGGYQVSCANSAAQAIGQLGRGHPYALVLCAADLFALPSQELLPLLRAHDPLLPVLFLAAATVTGAGTDGRLAEADFAPPEQPRGAGSLLDLVGQAVHVRAAACAQQTADLLAGTAVHAGQAGDRSAQGPAFAAALQQLYMVYQPIVHAADGRVFGLEALVRTSSIKYPHPGALFDAAEQQGQLLMLGRAIRAHVAHDIARLPGEATGPIFVNLHTRDLLDDALYDPRAPLSHHAARVVLEITERHALEEVGEVAERVRALRALGYRIAIDDLGAGYAGLTTLAHIEPEVVKLDMALVRDLHHTPIKRRIVRALADLCRDLQILVIAEGIESVAERDALVHIGVDYLQGYFFGRPERALKLSNTDRAEWRWPAIVPRLPAPCGCDQA